MQRTTLIKIHMLLAAFTFPAALLFLTTGGLYTWGVKGSYASETHTIALESPLVAEVDVLAALAEAELQRLSVAPPSGAPGMRIVGTSFQLEWTGSRRDVLLEPTADPLSARLTVKETTGYRHLVQLHKAKGGVLFKVYAALFAIALLLILASGFLMAWRERRYRALAAASSAAGVLLFVLAAWLS